MNPDDLRAVNNLPPGKQYARRLALLGVPDGESLVASLAPADGSWGRSRKGVPMEVDRAAWGSVLDAAIARAGEIQPEPPYLAGLRTAPR